MANRDGYPSHDMSPGRVSIEWWFDPNGSSNPTSFAATGHGVASVTRTDLGLYTVQLQDGWVLAAQASANMASPVDGPYNYAVVVGNPDVSTAKQVKIALVSAGGGVSNAGTRWASATAFALNSLIRPTVANANGHYYKATSVSGTGTSGATEPVWPTNGGTVTDNPGANQIVWTDQGMLTGLTVDLSGSSYRVYVGLVLSNTTARS